MFSKGRKILVILMAILFLLGTTQLFARSRRSSKRVEVVEEREEIVVENEEKQRKKEQKEKEKEEKQRKKEEKEREKKYEAKNDNNEKGFYVYKDFADTNNKFIPSGWMGDVNDIKFSPKCAISPQSGPTCIKIDYSSQRSGENGWAGIYWQYPANNWGDKLEGQDLKGYKMLTFWARGENGGEVISEFNVGGITGKYPDSCVASIGPVELTKKWKRYSIDLRDRDLTHIIGGFCFAVSADNNPKGFTVYLDNIKFEK